MRSGSRAWSGPGQGCSGGRCHYPSRECRGAEMPPESASLSVAARASVRPSSLFTEIHPVSYQLSLCRNAWREGRRRMLASGKTCRSFNRSRMSGMFQSLPAAADQLKSFQVSTDGAALAGTRRSNIPEQTVRKARDVGHSLLPRRSGRRAG